MQKNERSLFSRLFFLYYTFVLRMNNVNDRCLNPYPPTSRNRADQAADSGCKSKTFFRISKINRRFSPDPPPKKEHRRARRRSSFSIGQSVMDRFCGHKSTPFFFTAKSFKIFFPRKCPQNMRKRKDITHEKNRKYRHIYNTVRARKREKGLKEEENEKKKIFSAKRLFSRKCWRLVGNKGHTGGEKGVEKNRGYQSHKPKIEP